MICRCYRGDSENQSGSGAFGERLNRAGKNAVGLFYYAGHSVQVNGENYLLLVNVEISNEAEVDIEAVAMSSIRQKMAYAGNDMNILISLIPDSS